MENQTEEIGKIFQVEDLSKNLLKLFLNSEYSDITFIVEGIRYPMHKAILASRSEYFRALLFGNLRESSQEEIELKTDASSFYSILQFIYSGQIDLTALNLNVLLNILKSSHEWQMNGLVQSIILYLQTIVNIENVAFILNSAISLHLSDLILSCQIICDENTESFLETSSFLELSTESILNLITRDTFNAKEENIFNAVSVWTRQVTKEEADLVLKEIRLARLEPIFLLENVKDSGLISLDKITEAALGQYKNKNGFNNRVTLNKNFALLDNGATVIKGERNDALNGNFTDYDGENGYTFIREKEPIIFSLNEKYVVDSIELLLWDKDGRSYNYTLEVSTDQKNWEMISDNSQILCSSWQKIRFEERPVKFIKVAGQPNVGSRFTMKVVHLDVSLKREIQIN